MKVHALKLFSEAFNYNFRKKLDIEKETFWLRIIKKSLKLIRNIICFQFNHADVMIYMQLITIN